MHGAARKIAFLSPHCVLDFTNGAATATLDALAMLAGAGFHCEAFCNTRIDAWEEVLVEEILAKRGAPYHVRNALIGRFQGRMIFTTYQPQPALTPNPSPEGRGEHVVPVTLFNSASTRGAWINPEEIGAFLTGCEIFLRRNRPDLVWTYGGDAVSIAVQRLAKQLGIPVFFFLHNFGYFDRTPFAAVDRIAVPSQFSRAYYGRALGLQCDVLPYVIDPGRVGVRRTEFIPFSEERQDNGMNSVLRSGERPLPSPLPEGEGTYVTFVNPQAAKGLYVVARIAEMLARRRPDIPLLIVEGRNSSGWQQETGIDLARLGNVTVRPNTTDVRSFYAASKLILVPSLWNESFGLVAAEAMSNGIPVLAGNRGALPEIMDNAGFLFDIPARYTPETRELPTAEEVAPWVETIIRLWDDPAEYERWSRVGREHAQAWHPDRLASVYREYFTSITHQPGPVAR